MFYMHDKDVQEIAVSAAMPQLNYSWVERFEKDLLQSQLMPYRVMIFHETKSFDCALTRP